MESVQVSLDRPHCGRSGNSVGQRSTYPKPTWYQDPSQYADTRTGIPSTTYGAYGEVGLPGVNAPSRLLTPMTISPASGVASSYCWP